MRLYLDDDSISAVLVALLQKGGHDVLTFMADQFQVLNQWR